VINVKSSPKVHRIFDKLYNFFIFRKLLLLYKLNNKINSFPQIVHIQTVNSCNASCVMCPIGLNKKRKIEFMSNNLFKKIISEISKQKKQTTVVLYLQNEPFLDPNLFKKIHFIKKISKGRILTGISTNGSILNNFKIQELINSENDFIRVSLDAFTEETFHKIRKGLNYYQILKNINNLLKTNYYEHVSFGFVVQKYNYHELKDFIKFWEKKGGGLDINYLSNRSGTLPFFKELFFNPNNIFNIERLKHKISKKMIGYCPMPLTTFNILYNGDVIICCNDYKNEFILGNVNNSSIMQIWNNEEYNKFRTKIYNGEYEKLKSCHNCSDWVNVI